MVSNYDDETYFCYKLIINYLLTNLQVSKIFKDLSNSLSANIKLFETQLSRMIQSRRIIGIVNNMKITFPTAIIEEKTADNLRYGK